MTRVVEQPDWRGVRSQFRWSLQALAADAETQRSLFPAFVCKADELALDFDHWSEVVRANFAPEFSAEQLAALQAIDDRLAAMSRGGAGYDAALWSDAALSTRPEWEEIRSLARCALLQLSHPVATPPRGRSFYVPGGPAPT